MYPVVVYMNYSSISRIHGVGTDPRSLALSYVSLDIICHRLIYGCQARSDLDLIIGPRNVWSHGLLPAAGSFTGPQVEDLAMGPRGGRFTDASSWTYYSRVSRPRLVDVPSVVTDVQIREQQDNHYALSCVELHILVFFTLSD